MNFKREAYEKYWTESDARQDMANAQMRAMGLNDVMGLPGAEEARLAIRMLMDGNCVDDDSVARVGQVVAAICGEAAAHFILSTNNDQPEKMPQMNFMMIFAGIVNGALLAAASRHAPPRPEPANDAGDEAFDASGPDGHTLN